MTIESTNRTLTLGEYRVGVSFNPGGHPEVDQIKSMAAEFIDYIEDRKLGSDPEKLRLAAHAQTLIEDAAMNAVKFVTKPKR